MEYLNARMGTTEKAYKMNNQKENKTCEEGPKEERKLLHLLAVIKNTIERNREAIIRYRNMNDGIIGPGPDNAAVEPTAPCPDGLIYDLIERAEYLHDLCADFDSQNNRLNQIIVDG